MHSTYAALLVMPLLLLMLLSTILRALFSHPMVGVTQSIANGIPEARYYDDIFSLRFQWGADDQAFRGDSYGTHCPHDYGKLQEG